MASYNSHSDWATQTEGNRRVLNNEAGEEDLFWGTSLSVFGLWSREIVDILRTSELI